MDFSEKSLTYGLCLQVMFSGGWSTVLPSAVGFIAGTVCVNWCVNELPGFVYSACAALGKVIVDDAPAVMMARSVQRVGRSRRGNDVRQRAAAPAAAQPPPPPSEEAIEQLTSMGFEREAVIRALQMSGNNVEAAANRLLTAG